MTSFLFWNLRGHQEATWADRAPNLRTCINRLARTCGVDVFLFVESAFDPAELIASLNRARAGKYALPSNPNQRIQVITRLPPTNVVSQFDSVDGRLSIRRLLMADTDILLAVLHFQSQMHWTTTDRAFQATVVQEDIVRTEETVGHQRTVLVGDLNMNRSPKLTNGAQRAVPFG